MQDSGILYELIPIFQSLESVSQSRNEHRAERRAPLPNPGPSAYIGDVSSGTMAINAHVINGSDPGAVPGVSTNATVHLAVSGDEIGSTDV